MNYYTDLPDFVSNSELGYFDDLLHCRPKMEGLQAIYDFGNLVDCIKTEPHKFDEKSNTWTDDGGRSVMFDQHTVNQANDMVDALNNDPVLSAALEGAKFQYVFTRKRHEIQYNGEKLYLPMRMKADAYKPGTLIIDIKTTACTTLASFIQSISFFNYDRQAATYIDLSYCPRILYAGVSKSKNKVGKHPVFLFLIERGDEIYLSGLRKKNYLGYKYYHFIHSLNLPPLSIKI